MTIDIDAIRRREQAAAEGPWTTGADEAWSDALPPWALVINANYPLIELQEGAQGTADAEFIAHARTDVPALLAKVDKLTAELDRVRADLAAAHNHAHRQDTNLQQIVRAKDEIAAERDALKAAAEPLLEHIDLIRAHWAVLLPRDVGETLLARGAALAVLLPNTQEPCDICSGYGCPDCREDLSEVSR